MKDIYLFSPILVLGVHAHQLRLTYLQLPSLRFQLALDIDYSPFKRFSFSCNGSQLSPQRFSFVISLFIFLLNF